MIGEQIYSVEVAIVRCPGDGEDGGPLGVPVEQPTTVRYCGDEDLHRSSVRPPVRNARRGGGSDARWARGHI